MKKLLTPRGYLSWTQVDLWLRKPSLYADKYFFGGSEMGNAGQDFGSKTATALENGEDTDDELLNMLVSVLPRYQGREHEIRVPFVGVGGESVDLLGKLDAFDPHLLRFREYKTGIQPWTQHKADRHRQLDHYAALIWLKHGRVPPEIHLDWAETERAWDGAITLTGRIRTFQVKKTLADVLEYLSVVSRVAREIDEAYRSELRKAS